jgi:hypothetical protein
MRRIARILPLVGIGVISLLAARPVLAFPPLPSSFYGTVKTNGANVPDGVLIQALINGKLVSETQTKTYQGDSVYSLDIPGDEPGTLTVEGGMDGDPITFVIEGIVADQTGTWKSGTIISLNLSASSAATLGLARGTLTPVPTQTAILLMMATATPLAREIQSTPNPSTKETQSSPAKAVLNPASSLPTAEMPATLTIPIASNPDKAVAVDRTTNLDTGIIIAGFILFTIILFIILWLIHGRKPKAE